MEATRHYDDIAEAQGRTSIDRLIGPQAPQFDLIFDAFLAAAGAPVRRQVRRPRTPWRARRPAAWALLVPE